MEIARNAGTGRRCRVHPEAVILIDLNLDEAICAETMEPPRLCKEIERKGTRLRAEWIIGQGGVIVGTRWVEEDA